MVRKFTNKLIEMAEEGIISWESLASTALHWLSEDDVAELYRVNYSDYSEDEEDED